MWSPATLGEQSPLLSLLIQMLISARHILTDTLKLMFSPNIWVPSDSFRLIQKTGHQYIILKAVFICDYSMESSITLNLKFIFYHDIQTIYLD